MNRNQYVSFVSEDLPCRWTWAAVSGESVENCPYCSHTWLLTLGEGAESVGDCSMVEEELVEQTALRLGWAEAAEIEGVQYQNPVFVYEEGRDWAPVGQGQVKDNRFDFTIDIFW